MMRRITNRQRTFNPLEPWVAKVPHAVEGTTPGNILPPGPAPVRREGMPVTALYGAMICRMKAETCWGEGWCLDA